MKIPHYQFMKFFIIILTLLSGLNTWAESPSNLNKYGAILDGYDPVAYFKSSAPEKGKAQFQVKKNEATFWF